MVNGSNKYEHYQNLKELLEEVGFIVDKYSEINYGIQFKIVTDSHVGLYRIYESKKGITHDVSQIRDEELLRVLAGVGEFAKTHKKTSKTSTSASKALSKISDSKTSASDEKKSEILNLKTLIGTDESGKGDFFGPLVVAGVYTDEKTHAILRTLGVDDSKKLTDKKIVKLADDIKRTCEYSVVVIKNEKYNELYDKVKNLNRLLAWAHSRIIENLLDKVDCKTVLADKFGKEELIKSVLMQKGKDVTLYQETKAEANVAVAAASIIARAEFVKQMDAMHKKFGIEFPKGASASVIAAGNLYANSYGKENLGKVAKLNFKTVDKIRG